MSDSQVPSIPNLEELETGRPRAQPGAELVSWIMGRVREWEERRDQAYGSRWPVYYRLWRGFWSPQDKNRESERSRIITPVLSQAIETSVAELEEAIFGNEQWFDIEDDIADQDKQDAMQARDQLLEDMELVDVQSAISEALLNAAIYGTGIVKVNVREMVVDSGVGRTIDGQPIAQNTQRVMVTFEPVRPEDFIPDPAAETITDMLGCAHKINNKPLHAILEAIEQGRYREDALPGLIMATATEGDDPSTGDPEALLFAHDRHSGLEVVEYHGKVPANLLAEVEKSERDLIADALQEVGAEMPEPTASKDELVEAIVTIANGSVLLSAKRNPFIMQDRAFVAWPWEKVPGRFWGRGVAEKGFNPQVALDAEVRMRIDALGFLAAPMIVTNAGAIPRGFSTKVYPGKNWIVQGIPKESIDVLTLNANLGATFNQSGDMERLVELGTGALNAATPVNQNERNSTATGGNLIRAAFVKRAKRAIYSCDRKLLTPMIRKAMWRYMQFDRARYPRDFKFVIKATMGIVAREQETLELTQLLGMMGDEYPNVKVAITRGIIENTSVKNKKQILDLVDQALQPPPPEIQQAQQQSQLAALQRPIVELQELVTKINKLNAEIEKLRAEAAAAAKRADLEDERVTIEAGKLMLARREVEAFERQNDQTEDRISLDRDKLALDREKLDVERQKLRAKSTQSST